MRKGKIFYFTLREIDEQTTLSGVPKEAWDYKLGNRSALEWILDQYKEMKPKDKTIAERFHTYGFAMSATGTKFSHWRNMIIASYCLY